MVRPVSTQTKVFIYDIHCTDGVTDPKEEFELTHQPSAEGYKNDADAKTR